MRGLGRAPDRQDVLGGIVSRQHPAALDRMTAASGLMKSIGIDVRGLSEGFIHMSERQVQFRHHIVRRSAVDRRRARRHCRNTIDDGFQGLVLDLDRGERIFRLLPALGDDYATGSPT